MPSPYIIAGAAAGVALLGYGLMRKVKAGTLTKAEKEKTFKAAYDAGFSSGKDDGTADAGKVHNPRGLLNYSDVKEVQQQYDNGYNDGYEKFWTAPPKVDVTLDSSPSAGGKTSRMSAYDYGCSRGTSSGRADGASGADSSWGYNLETAGSKKRQAESGNPAEYREGYKKCYIAAYAVAYAAKGTLADSEGKLGKDELGIDWFSVSGLSNVGRLKQRAPVWQGGQRIDAVSGMGDMYIRAKRKLGGKPDPKPLVPGQPLTFGTVDYDSGFRAGYAECKRTGGVWPALAPIGNAAYRRGWDDGARACLAELASKTSGSQIAGT